MGLWFLHTLYAIQANTDQITKAESEKTQYDQNGNRLPVPKVNTYNKVVRDNCLR